MKKLLIFIYVVCIATTAVYSQDSLRIDRVVLTVHNNESKSQLFVKTLNNSVQIMTSDWDFPVLPVFKSLELTDGKITSVQILGDDNKYNVNSENVLTLAEPQSNKKETAESTEPDNSIQLFDYTIKESGNQLTITFDNIVYGSSKYPGQTLAGKCEMIYIRP